MSKITMLQNSAILQAKKLRTKILQQSWNFLSKSCNFAKVVILLLKTFNIKLKVETLQICERHKKASFTINCYNLAKSVIFTTKYRYNRTQVCNFMKF